MSIYNTSLDTKAEKVSKIVPLLINMSKPLASFNLRRIIPSVQRCRWMAINTLYCFHGAYGRRWWHKTRYLFNMVFWKNHVIVYFWPLRVSG